MATTLSSFEALPHQIMTTVLEYLPLGNVYLLERTSKSLRAAVEFNPYLKYKTADGERSINPLQSCGAYAVHHAWRYIDYSLFDSLNRVRLIRYNDAGDRIDVTLKKCNLLDKPAIYPFINHLKLEAIQYAEVDEIDVSSRDGSPLTFRDLLKGLNRALKDDACDYIFFMYLNWKALRLRLGLRTDSVEASNWCIKFVEQLYGDIFINHMNTSLW